MSEAIANCGGHITLLFSIHSDSEDLMQQGSRGAGFNVEAGAICRVSTKALEKGEDFSMSIAVFSDGVQIEDEDISFLYVDIFEEYLQRGLLDESLSYTIDVQLELPLSQGFGMSAAGLMACSTALCELHNLDIDAAHIAHLIERRNSSGLGDVLASTVGGVELRLEPGAPNLHGKAASFVFDSEVILCWDSKAKRHTSTYIDDEKWKISISSAGEDAMSRLRVGDWKPSRWPELINEAQLFAEKSGMMEEESRVHLLRRVENELPDGYAALLCMLGTSVCIIPKHAGEIPTSLTDSLEGVDYLRTWIS